MKDGRTIYALSTPPGRSGVAIVRISGPAAGMALTALGGHIDRPRYARLATLREGAAGPVLDRALTLWFPGPSSFTGEDVAEIQLHGGRAVIAGVLEALGRMTGLEPAESGGFTRQAFANGKLDLTEVEGLADLVDAETEAQRRLALRQMEGGLSGLYDGWRRELVRLMAHIEAEIDFADEELPEGLARAATERIGTLADEMARHLNDGRRGERLRDGFRIVLAGPPNAGKSSLLNALARRDVAIVSPEAGTTRDVLDVALDLGGYPALVSDTAGLRETGGAVEAEGVRRARARAATADLVLWLRDASDPAAPAGPGDLEAETAEVWTKCDLAAPPEGGLAISVVTGEGIDVLIAELASRAAAGLDVSEGGVITRARHRAAVERAEAALRAALAAGDSGAELVAENLRSAAFELGRLTGRVDVEDLLDVIFADFCIGK